MRVAFIEPYAHLEDFHTDYHMVLPTEAFRSLGLYREYFRTCGGYKILDNGACEGQLFQPEELIVLGWELGIDEIVIPDVMGDYNGTKELARQFAFFMQRADLPPGYEPHFTGVAHGQTMAEVIACIRTFAMQRFIDTLALPRILATTLGDEFIRYHLMDPASAFYNEIIKPNFSNGVHCLGATANPREVVMLANTPVRGIDTSLPGVMSLADKNIARDPYVSRSAGYFDGAYKNDELAKYNHNTYLQWANNWGFVKETS